jgi:hypothetical protein
MQQRESFTLMHLILTFSLPSAYYPLPTALCILPSASYPNNRFTLLINRSIGNGLRM